MSLTEKCVTILQNSGTTTILIGSFTFIFVYMLCQWVISARQKLPPSPIVLPIIGNLTTVLGSLLLGEETHDMVGRLSKLYGKIFCVYIGGNIRLVYLNDLKSVTEAFRNHALTDRVPNHTVQRLTGADDVLAGSGDLWHHQRRFCLSVFRSFGVGTHPFQTHIATEAQKLCHEFATFDRQPFDHKNHLSCATSNIVCSIIFGKQFDYGDEQFIHMLSLQDKRLQLIGAGGLFTLIPILRYIFFWKAKENEEIVLEILIFFKSIVEDRKRTTSDQCRDELEDIIDRYLHEIAKNDSNPSPSAHIEQRHLVSLIDSLFLAGTETTASTLNFLLLDMAAKPDVQRQIQDEIERVCGSDRLPLFVDQERMPFTQAVIMEASRLYTIVPLGVPHYAGQDTTIQDYHIPKGSIVMANLWGVMHDPDVWTDPDEFIPERFIDDEGAVTVPDEWIPFSTGRRICIGEKLAEMELFIFLTHLLSRFSFHKPSDVESYDLHGRSGATYSPMPYKLCAIPRVYTDKVA